MMIFNKDKKNIFFYNNFIVHLIILIFISLNLLSFNFLVDFVLITGMVIYLSKGSKIKWHYPLFIFIWGLYSDLIIGYPIGYSSTVFLFFLLLNQVSNFFGIFFIDTVRFLIFFAGLILILTIEHLAIYFQFTTNLSIYIHLSEILFVIIFYYPVNYLIKNNLNFYAPKE